MSLKDNFNQAIRDILKKELVVNDEPPKAPVRKAEMDSFMSSSAGRDLHEDLFPDPTPVDNGYSTSFSEAPPTADAFRQAVHNLDPFAEQPMAAEPTPAPAAESVSYGSTDYNGNAFESRGESAPPPPAQTSRPVSGYGGGYTPPPRGPVFRGGRPPETPYYETEETTIISRNTCINGDVRSFANVNIEGSVQGDIKLTKNVAVSGTVVGDIECNNAVMTGAKMQGSISSKGQVQFDHDSMLLGDIDTQYLDLNGRIKGNVDVTGKAEFKNDAVIIGNISASTISVIDGAIIQGYVNTTFMQDSTSNVFPEAISINEA